MINNNKGDTLELEENQVTEVREETDISCRSQKTRKPKVRNADNIEMGRK